MTTRRSFLAATAAALILTAAPLWAHHSYSMFDMSRTIALKGTVDQFKWQNPHAWIQVDVPVKGQVERWAIEMTAPNNLIREGWKRTTLKGGDQVTLYVHPLRSGSKGGSYVGVRLADGSTLGTVE